MLFIDTNYRHHCRERAAFPHSSPIHLRVPYRFFSQYTKNVCTSSLSSRSFLLRRMNRIFASHASRNVAMENAADDVSAMM
jgi:hypothetical protein